MRPQTHPQEPAGPLRCDCIVSVARPRGWRGPGEDVGACATGARALSGWLQHALPRVIRGRVWAPGAPGASSGTPRAENLPDESATRWWVGEVLMSAQRRWGPQLGASLVRNALQSSQLGPGSVGVRGAGRGRAAAGCRAWGVRGFLFFACETSVTGSFFGTCESNAVKF